MDITTIIIAVAAVVVGGLIVWAIMSATRRRRLRHRFGPEYDRVTSQSESRRDAHAELEARKERRERFDIRPLDPAAAERYRTRWRHVQADFVDRPESAMHEADLLIQEVMRERGYPVEDFDRRAADLSVDHPDVVEDYRQGHRVARRHADGGATTEELREAMIHYRQLFERLVDAGEHGNDERVVDVRDREEGRV